jgi:hypothetical protein
MAVVCGSGFVLIGLAGWGAVVPGLIFAAFAAGFTAWGSHALWISRRSPEDDPELLPVPDAVDGVLTIRKTSALGLVPFLLFTVLSWGLLALCIPSAFGLADSGGSVVAGLVICGLFVWIGHGGLIDHAVTVRLDLRHRTWDVRKGVFPICLRKRGDLAEASHVAVARELRWDDGSEYEVLVARLEWQDGWLAPLVLDERPNEADALQYGPYMLKMDYRRAMMRWASDLASVLNLPVTDRAKKAPGAEC